MKNLKIKKCMTSFFMLVVMVVSIIGILPKSVAYADESLELPEFDFRWNNLDNELYFNLYKWDPSCIGDTVSFWNPETQSFCNAIISTSPLKDQYTEYNYRGKYGGGSELSRESVNTSYSGSFEARGKTYYYVWYSMRTYGGHIGYQVKKGICFGSKDFDCDQADKYICEYILKTLPTSFTVIGENGVDTNAVPDGSENNPLSDKDIGTIILKSHGFISTKNEQFIGDVSCSYDYYFKYKDKTSSGFSLTDNKYARTFIEVKVQNQCVLYNKDNEDIIEEYYPHYGEYYTYKRFPLENIDNNTLRVGWGDIYSKWNDYSEYPLATNKKLSYRFMIRVVCTDSLTVIPDEKSGWYAGGWRSILFDGSKFVEETNGHVDNDGKWKDDKDDGHNSSSDKTSHNNESKDDVDKILNDDSGSSSGSSGVAGIKSFLKDVGNVPKAIGKLFSFLPSWCTDFIAFGFVVLVALMIIKAIRG